MIWNLDVSWLFMAIAVVSMLSFFLGLALDGVMGDDGFGSLGNAVIITGGFFIGIFVANVYGMNLKELKMAVMVGMLSAFCMMSMLSFGKTLISRI